MPAAQCLKWQRNKDYSSFTTKITMLRYLSIIAYTESKARRDRSLLNQCYLGKIHNSYVQCSVLTPRLIRKEQVCWPSIRSHNKIPDFSCGTKACLAASVMEGVPQMIMPCYSFPLVSTRDSMIPPSITLARTSCTLTLRLINVHPQSVLYRHCKFSWLRMKVKGR